MMNTMSGTSKKYTTTLYIVLFIITVVLINLVHDDCCLSAVVEHTAIL